MISLRRACSRSIFGEYSELVDAADDRHKLKLDHHNWIHIKYWTGAHTSAKQNLIQIASLYRESGLRIQILDPDDFQI